MGRSCRLFPSPYPQGNWQPAGLQFEDVQFAAADGTPLRTFVGHTGLVDGTLELVDGRFLSWVGQFYYGEDHALRLWTANGTPLAVFYGDAPITCCVLSRDEFRATCPALYHKEETFE